MEPPHTLNPVTKLWQKLGCNALLLSKLSEYMKLAHIIVTALMGSCEDERIFSTLSFVKNKVKNQLQGNLDTCSAKAGTLLNPFLTTKCMISGQSRKSRGLELVTELSCLHNVCKSLYLDYL